MKKILTVIGARPQIIKSSAISRAIQEQYSQSLEEVIIHTGQHYDANMSEVFFSEMKIPRPKYNLNVGSGSHGSQTAKMIESLEQVAFQEKPDVFLVYGDTNSTLAGAVVASKLHIPLVHVEAGLRSFNKSMPEEVNRIMCDHVSSLLFAPTQTAIENLRQEGFRISHKEKASIDQPKVFNCGDVMYDNSLHFSQISDQQSTLLEELGLQSGRFILSTIHRDSNTDIGANLTQILEALMEIAERTSLPIVLPLHPRTKNKMREMITSDLCDNFLQHPSIHLIDPVGFLDMIALEKNACIVITDSGGLQKEAYFFKKPCVIMREQTEWVEIVSNGNARTVGANQTKIVKAAMWFIENQNQLTYPALYGDGTAAAQMCSYILSEL